MMNRVLKRPMFRMGGSSSDGIMTGVDRAPYQFGTKPIDFPGTQEDYDKQMQELQDKGIFNVSGSRTGGPKKITNTEDKNEFNIEDLKTDDSEVTTEFERRKALMDSLVGKSALPMSSFLTQFGLNLASASPRGGLIATAAEAAKEPLKTFQAMKVQERSDDKDLLESVIESMSEEDLSSLEKKVKRGVESGFFKNEAEGYNTLLKKEIEGVQYGPGELDRINVARYADAYLRSDAGEELTVPAAESIFRVYQQVEKGKIAGADASQFDPSRIHISGAEKQPEIVNGEETGRDILVLNEDLDKEDYFKDNIYVNPGENRVYRFDGTKFIQVGE
tara:strand:+ start:421 stop:1419 length:999 start_codon:yes stop_codon:yes gene_type:complete